MTLDKDKKPYLIDAVIGNSRFLGSVLRTGRMVRLWWPNADLSQHVDTIRSGIRMEGKGRTSWFDEAKDGWAHAASYVPRTNIFKVRAESEQFPITVETDMFAVPDADIIVSHYQFTNTGTERVRFSFVYYSALMIGEYPHYHTCMFDEELDALTQFRHRVYIMASSVSMCAKFQACHAWENAEQGMLNGKTMEMAPDGAMAWELEIDPGEAVSFPLYLTAGHTHNEAKAAMHLAKSRPVEQWTADTAAYWIAFLDEANPCPLPEPDIVTLYERSLLAMMLMADEQSGSIIAAPEFDEHFSRCGGYAFCWGRDAAFITTALDRAGLTEMSTNFYRWTLTAQDKDGSWQQRHYHDGALAPSWGLQIDEGASILWGMFEHYNLLPEDTRKAFAQEVWPAVEAGAEFLVQSINKESGLPLASMDLWEERKGEHTYSSAAVYAGLKAAAQFANLFDQRELADRWSKAASGVAETIMEDCWNEQAGVFYRGKNLHVSKEAYDAAVAESVEGTCSLDSKGYPVYQLLHDPIVDVSLLGISFPFGVIPPEHPYARRTADAIERELTVPQVGGIKRYENDHYIGSNPWILTTLWLAQYRVTVGQYEEARKLLQWAVDHQTMMGLLPEQIDGRTGETAWVVPLTWSHAMFILTVFMVAGEQ